MERLRGTDRWMGLNLAAVVWGVVLVGLACIVHDRGSASDPDMIFHSYTLVQDVAPRSLTYAPGPAPSLLVPAGVRPKAT